MSKSQCYNEISRNNQLINQYRAKIDTLENDIRELGNTKNKLLDMKSKLIRCKTHSNSKLSSNFEVNRINSKLAGKIFNKMNDLLNGAEYRSVFSGLERGIDKVDDTIISKKKEIDDLKNKIASCKRKISNMNNQIRAYEAEERAEQAAREAEEALNRK